MNTKKIPAIVMLLAGLVVCIVTYIERYEFRDILKILMIVLIVFLIIGLVIKWLFDSFDISNDKTDDDGEVVEKQSEDAEGEADGFDGQFSEADKGE